jgi:dUTP pyrophosphatase
MNALKIKIKSSHVKPVVGSDGAAGMDLRADSKEMLIEAGVEYTFCTGVAIEIPKGYVGLVLPRSGMGTKKGMKLKNTTGVIDSDYRGYIKVTCSFTETFWLESYERIAQLVIVSHYKLDNIDIVDELSETGRGATGFGSSGRT